MLNFEGRPLGKATPSVPIVVTGFKELPNFGDRFIEVKDEKAARKLALLNAQKSADDSATANVTSTDLLRMMNTSDNTKTFNVIVKGDVLGSVTSVVDSLKMIDTKGEITLNIVSQSVGDVTENDISEDSAVIYGFNVGIPNSISKMAARANVDVRLYKVIYELLDDAKSSMEALLGEEVVEEKIGELAVKGVFRTEKTSLIAGGEVTDGHVIPDAFVKIYRKKELLGEAKVKSVQKEKVETKELVAGEIGGLSLETTKRIPLAIGDRLEFFTRETKKKTL